MRKVYAILIFILLAFSLFPIIKAQEGNPLGVAGYVYNYLGNPLANIQVNITNVNTSESKILITNSQGLYAGSIVASDGDILQVKAKHNGVWGINQTTVDTNLLTQWINITINDSINPPIARFTYHPNNPSSDTIIHFEDLSYDTDGNIVTWKWDFGDNTISYERNPTHVYGSEGKFKVILMVKDDDGLWGSTWDYITVEDENNTEHDVIIPPMPPPIYPTTYYTVEEMYHMLKIDKLEKTDGKVKVAVIDTGITQRVYDGHNMYLIEAYYHPSLYDPYDDVGHGTWCNYAVFYGLDTFTQGKQYSIKVIQEGGCSNAVFIDGLEQAKDLGVDVVSISLGGFGSAKGEIAKKIDELRKEGIIVICAGGNYGPYPNSITTPGLSPSAIAVGSVDPMRTLDYYDDDTISSWSSRGPVEGVKEVKPDIVAGGESIIGPWLYGERVASGTSMSTPIVAGGCAVVYAEHEKLWEFLKKEYWLLSIGNIFGGKRIVPFIFERALEKTAYGKGDGNIYGHGIPQFDKMEKYAVYLIIIGCILIWYLYKRYRVGHSFSKVNIRFIG